MRRLALQTRWIRADQIERGMRVYCQGAFPGKVAGVVITDCVQITFDRNERPPGRLGFVATPNTIVSVITRKK